MPTATNKIAILISHMTPWQSGQARTEHRRCDPFARRPSERRRTSCWARLCPEARSANCVKLLDEGNWTGELKHRTKDGRELTIESRLILEMVDRQQLALESTRNMPRKAWETQQTLLLRDLTQRVKNTPAVVQSIAHQMRRSSRSHDEFTALAVAHSLRSIPIGGLI